MRHHRRKTDRVTPDQVQAAPESAVEVRAETPHATREAQGPASTRDFIVLELDALNGERIVWCRDRMLIHKARKAHPGLIVYLEPEVLRLLQATEGQTREQANTTIRRLHRLKKKMNGWVVGCRPAKNQEVGS